MTRHLATRHLLTLALIAGASAGPLGAQVIDTRNGDPAPSGGYALGASGSNYAFREMGESFVAPAGFTVLESFAFFLTRSVGGTPPLPPGGQNDFTFQGVVRAFDGTNPVGPDLFASAPRTRLATEPANVGTQELFTTGGLTLTPGSQYVAFLRALETNPLGGRTVGYYQNDRYAPGVIYQSPEIPGLTTGQDLGFVATFSVGVSAVPEPGTWALLGTGLLGIAGVARARRRTA